MKRLVAMGAAIAAFGFVQDAHAFEFGTRQSEHPYRSRQNFALELRFSPYTPNVDDEPGLNGRTPFADSFGTSPRLCFGLEFDWQTFRIPYVGTLGPGFGAHLVGMSRPSVTKENPPRASGDEYALDIYPFYLSAVLRADTFWRDLGFPIIPYAKLGVGTALWRASNTGGTSSFNGVSGKGHSNGTHMAIGAAFVLDVFDRGASVNMDNAIGINTTLVYLEYYWLNYNGIGQDKVLYVGTNTWAAGLAFEF